MKKGDLVKLRPGTAEGDEKSVGIGLIIKEHVAGVPPGTAPYSVWEVTIYGTTYRMLRNRRYLARDLEVING